MYQGITPTPDPGFVRKLKEYSKDLRIVFSRKYSRFIIQQKGKISGWVDAFMIKGPDNTGCGYRQPDERDLELLFHADRHRKGQEYKDVIRDGEQAMKDSAQKSMDEAADTLRQATIEDKRQLMNTYNKAVNQSKGVTGFRQVPIKKKGYTVHDLRKLRTRETDQVSPA
jgi:hypothetical protein